MVCRYLISAILATALLPFPAGAGEDSEEEQLERRFRAMKEAVMDDVRELVHKSDRRSRIQPLGKMLTLEFKLVPMEKKDRAQSVTVATESYGVDVRMVSEGNSFGLGVRGELVLVGKEKQEVGITFHTTLEFRTKEHTGHIAATGSAIVPIGQSATLANLGEKSLVVKVTEIGEK